MHDIADLKHTFANRTKTDHVRPDIKRRENVVAFPGDSAGSFKPPLLDPRHGSEIKRASAISAEWSQRVGGYVHLPMLMRESGLEPATMLDCVHLPHDALDDEDSWVPYAP